MCGKSHISLGHYLIDRYFSEHPRRYRQAFLLGCIEPDRNPATYLKGSLRFQWLRGHNYKNARRFMTRISTRLEKKKTLNLFDYYTLGKLIHYTADAFTFAHNDTFPTDLSCHREYEIRLQTHFLNYLQKKPTLDVRLYNTIMEGISSYHREYFSRKTDIQRDSHFALRACCCVLAILLTPRIL